MTGFTGCPVLYEKSGKGYHLIVQQSPNFNEGYVIWLRYGNWDEGVVGETRQLSDAKNFVDHLGSVYWAWLEAGQKQQLR